MTVKITNLVKNKLDELARRVFANPNPFAIEFKINEVVKEIDEFYKAHYEALMSQKSDIEKHIPSNVLNPEVTSAKPKKKK